MDYFCNFIYVLLIHPLASLFLYRLDLCLTKWIVL